MAPRPVSGHQTVTVMSCNVLSTDRRGDGRAWCSALDADLIDEAPQPRFIGLEGPDHRVAGPGEMGRSMPVRALVAAAHMATGLAQAQMDPPGAGPQAILAAVG